MDAELFAGLPVSDHARALPWYEQLLGEPSFSPHDTETVWTLADQRHVYVVEEPGAAGGGRVTLFVDDLDAALGEISARSLEPTRTETYSNGVRKATFTDADGNEVGLGGAPG